MSTNYNDIINEFKKLKLEDYLEIRIASEYGNIELVLEKARCKFIGNICLEIDDAISVYFKDDFIIHNRVVVPLDMFEYYYKLLEQTENKYMLFAIKSMMSNQLKENDIIKFSNGRKGVILKPTKEDTQIHYKLLKKDGSLGTRIMTLYAKKPPEYDYICENREFVNYDY